MKRIPPYTFEKPWNMGRCQIRIGNFLYDVVSTVIAPCYRRWYAVRDGRPITKMRAKFTTLLRDLGDLAAAEIPPPGVFIADEMEARGWTTADVAMRMGGDAGLNMCCVDMLIAVHDRNLILDAETANGLARAFDVSPEYFLNLDKAWRLGRHPHQISANRTALLLLERLP